jgi:ABC-type nitrate/sulfonate/bicarbonate transport system substrate-binding protein
MRSIVRRPFVALAALLASLTLPVPSPAQAPAGVTDVTFGSTGPNSSDWPFYLADQLGFFRAAGLHVTLIETGNPTQTINELATGSVDIATDGTDTIVAAVVHHLPVKIIAPQMIDDPFALVVPPSIASWAQLRGKAVTLSEKQDVTAMSFYRMAQANHLDPARDFTLFYAATTNQRFAALASGNVQGALLAQPFDFRAESQGMRILARSSTYMKDWMYKSVVVNTAWAAAHRADVVRFVAALRKAVAYGYAHPQEAVNILVTATKVDNDSAQKAYQLDFTQSKAFSTTGMVPRKGLQAVIDGMIQIGSISSAPPIADVLDDSYARDAQRMPL